jgi:hypothetical protein
MMETFLLQNDRESVSVLIEKFFYKMRKYGIFKKILFKKYEIQFLKQKYFKNYL